MAATATRAAIQASRRQIIPGIFSLTRMQMPALVQGQYSIDLDKTARMPLNYVAARQPFEFGFGLAAFGQDKSQGEEVTGDHPAENPRNDVPPISPEDSEQHPELPPSPDAADSTSNKSDYHSPGEHPHNTKDSAFEPDMDNASPAVTQKTSGAADMDAVSSCGSPEQKSIAQAQDSRGVQAAPVEALMETPLQENNEPSSDRTGPSSHDDNPPGVDKDPNVVPPLDDDDDKKVDKADKEALESMSI